MTYTDRLIERAQRAAQSLTTREPMTECPYPAGMQSEAYTAGRAAEIIRALIAEVQLMRAEAEA